MYGDPKNHADCEWGHGFKWMPGDSKDQQQRDVHIAGVVYVFTRNQCMQIVELVMIL